MDANLSTSQSHRQLKRSERTHSRVARNWRACSFMRGLEYITIPLTVHEIGEDAFFYCTDLARVQLHAGLQKIESNAFDGCCSLYNITIPFTVQAIGWRAFGDCRYLKIVHLHKWLQWIDAEDYFCCSSLKDITIPSTVQVIGENAFGECATLVSARFDEDWIKSISRMQFTNEHHIAIHCQKDWTRSLRKLYQSGECAP